ncbi:hypothetical protein GWI34_00955 [Actinomadura sp. DSM 109109]|nr:hypothetical protein [Actinomadura lepetitiana]
MTTADLARHLADASDDESRWRLLVAFLEKYGHRPLVERVTLLADESGDHRAPEAGPAVPAEDKPASTRAGSSPRSLRVVVYGFTPIMRLGLATALQHSPRVRPLHIEVTRSRDRLIEVPDCGGCDLLILDPACPSLSCGLRICRQVKSGEEPPRILAFSALSRSKELLMCQMAGIDSFVSSREGVERLAAAALSTVDGHREWLLGPAPRIEGDGLAAGAVDRLTSRQRQVLWLLFEHRTNHQIAETLCISPNTAKNHVTAILRKLGVSRRADLTPTQPAYGLEA